MVKNSKIKGLVFLCIGILMLISIVGINTPWTRATPKGEAFGHPGACPTWSASTLTFIGTAQNPTSQVWFTGLDGIIGEVFYPTPDKAATVDWQCVSRAS